MTPEAPWSGTSTSAATACDTFLVLRTVASVSRLMPPYRTWLVPVISCGRPAMVASKRSTRRSSRGSTSYLRGLLQEELLQLAQLVGHLRGQVVRLGPVVRAVQLPDVVVEGRQLGHRDPGRGVLRHGGPALGGRRPRLPPISKYWVSWRSVAVPSSNE